MQAACACTRRPQPLHGLGGHTHVHLRTAYACPRSHSLRTRTHAVPKRIAHARFPHARSAQARSAHARTAHARTRPGSLRPGSLRPRSLRPMVKVRKSFRRTSAKGGQDGGLDVEHRRRRPRRTRRRRARRRRTRRNVGAEPAAVAAEAATQHPQPAAQGTGRGSLSQVREGQRGECSLGRQRAGRRGRGQNHLRIAAARSGWRCSLREMLATMRALTSLLMSRMSCLRAGTPAAVMRA